MELLLYWLWEMIRWSMKAQNSKPVMDFVCRNSTNNYVTHKLLRYYIHIWNCSKWIYCPNQKFKQYFECDKKTKSKVFADRVCDGAPDCPGHQGHIQNAIARGRTHSLSNMTLSICFFEWIDENGTLGKCKTKNNKDGCCETMNMKLTKRMYDKNHNKFYNDIDKSRCLYEGKCSEVATSRI